MLSALAYELERGWRLPRLSTSMLCYFSSAGIFIYLGICVNNYNDKPQP